MFRPDFLPSPSACWRWVMASAFGLALAVVAFVPISWRGDLAEAETRPKTKSAVAAPVAPPVLPDPPLPVRQAQEAGVGQCAPVLNKMSHDTLASTYDLQSGWSRADPSHHIFQSVIALNTPGNVPPDGFAALIAAPVTAGSCDGVAMQVFPLATDCPTAQTTMLRNGKLFASMLNTRIMLDARGNRVILLPAYNRTCIAISVDTTFGIP